MLRRTPRQAWFIQRHIHIPDELSPTIIRKLQDDELSDLYLLSVEEVKQSMLRQEFKPNCALIMIDFAIRQGIVTPEMKRLCWDYNKGVKDAICTYQTIEADVGGKRDYYSNLEVGNLQYYITSAVRALEVFL